MCACVYGGVEGVQNPHLVPPIFFFKKMGSQITRSSFQTGADALGILNRSVPSFQMFLPSGAHDVLAFR